MEGGALRPAAASCATVGFAAVVEELLEVAVGAGVEAVLDGGGGENSEWGVLREVGDPTRSLGLVTLPDPMGPAGYSDGWVGIW